MSAWIVVILLEKKESCHQLSVSRKSPLLPCDKLVQEEIELIQYRFGCFDLGTTGTKISLYHKIYFLQKFQTYQRTCCDPFYTHEAKVKSWGHLLTLEDAKDFPFVKLVLDKICFACCYEQLKLKKMTIRMILISVNLQIWIWKVSMIQYLFLASHQ